MKAIQRVRCPRCCVGYRVGDKPTGAKQYRCADCRLVFWESVPCHKPIRLGITPEDKAEWMGEAR